MIYDVINKTHVPIKLWAPVHEVESEALDQLTHTANLPCVFKHIAVMPDVHLGKGATVGSVIATKGAVIPAAVGVDIGCGMMAIQTSLTSHDLPDSLTSLRTRLEQRIPVGPTEHKDAVEANWEGFTHFKQLPSIVHDRLGKAQRQLGTLGGGNHFIELCLDTEDHVWLMLHSGSRNIGKLLADVHITTAKNLMRDYFVRLPDPDLAYLVEGSREFDAYWNDLQWAQDYAMRNRQLMMKLFIDTLIQELNRCWGYGLTINCHHNYAAREHHFGSNVIVTRKGAVRAREDDYGIIPGSMGTRSYIVKGKGNADSFCSCSHGAGRRMSRGKAKVTFTLDDLTAQTAGVECRKDTAVIDEIPGAYKDIDQVMENQKDLVTIVATLKQILCIKG